MARGANDWAMIGSMAPPSVSVEIRDVPGLVPVRGRVLMLPGARHSVDHPLLHWAAEVLEQSGWQVNAVRWDLDGYDGPAADFVVAGADELLAQAPPAERTLVVAKSLGSHAAPWAQTHGFSAIWLTPLLTDHCIRTAIEASAAPALVIGGTQDPLWAPLVARPGLEIEQIDGADHGLRLADWRGSLRVVTEVSARIERFAATL